MNFRFIFIISLVSRLTTLATFDNISFSFANFDSNYHQIYRQDNASITQLAVDQRDKDLVHSSGQATYYKPMHLWDNVMGNMANFSTQFTFIINSLGSDEQGDGFAFFLASGGSQIPGSFAQNLSVLLTGVSRDSSSGENVSSIPSIVNLKDCLPESGPLGFSGSFGWLSGRHSTDTWESFSGLEVRADIVSTDPNITTTPVMIRAKRSNHTRFWITLGCSAGIALFVLVPCLGWFFCGSKRYPKDEIIQEENEDLVSISEELKDVTGGRKFCYKELVVATNNFADDRLLGQGGFGEVYKGYLTNMTHVAIKKITPESRQGVKEYASEVKTMSQLRHKNLVQRIGWCHEKKEFLLVYEFMSQGSLDCHLFKGKTLLTWQTRYKIARAIAWALHCLHEEWEQSVIHRDIKSSNIMLDEKFNAKLGDFGLARLVDHAKGTQTTALAGTMGYLAPECIQTSKASKESDVCSFGVVLLEIVCGRKVVDSRPLPDNVGLVEWVWEHYGTGSLLEALDPKLVQGFDEKQVECLTILGLWCAHPDYKLRPSIREATSVLNGEALPPGLPTKMPVPTYLAPFSGISILSPISSYKTATANKAGDLCV